MQTIAIDQLEGHLAEMIESLPPGEEVIITRDDKPVARLVGGTRSQRPGPGLGKGMITIVADADSKESAVDDNGWPVGFFDKTAGSMPNLDRGPQRDLKDSLLRG